MAKITITITDLPEGGVSTVADPNFETIMKMAVSGENLTSAHAYAISALRHILGKSKELNEKDKLIKIPKLGRY